MTKVLDKLVVIPANPMPEGGDIHGLAAADGAGLRSAYWPAADARGTVCVFPGRSEFIEKYFEVIGELRLRGFAVAALDWRGQGGSERELSDPRKGHIDDFDLFLRDLDAFLDHLERVGAPKPWYGLAHSMGGAILVLATARGEKRLKRLVLSAPMLGLHGAADATIARHIIQAANAAGLGAAYVPGAGARAPSAYQPFQDNPLTSDPDRYQRQCDIMIAGPDLTIGPPTIAWLAAAFRLLNAMQAPDFGVTMGIPMLVVAAGADTIVSTSMVETLTARFRGAHCITIPGARHELLMERDPIRAQFWAAFDAFVPGS
ncbi:MAG TPA: alpha/beta hydrolase [Beijerinckiaceae bacterium]|nr:alpha/beta hydrolase [Beijerinckiaceae bacterium]